MNVLITGATSGIGRALAFKLASLGHHVYACCHTVEELKRVNERQYSNITYLKLDLTNRKDYLVISNLEIDVLINQAGLGIGGSLLDLKIDEIERNYEVNVFSTLRLTKYYIEDCYQKGRRGKVLITSSLAGYLPIPFMGSYVATKSSLIILTKVLKKELSISNVDVSVKLILPGAYHTGFNQYMLGFISKSKYFEKEEKIYLFLEKLFLVIEKKNTKSIVKKMVLAVESKSSRLFYSAPFFQSLLVRIYRMFGK